MTAPKVVLSSLAVTRIDLVRRHGFHVDQQILEEIIANSEQVDDGGTGMKIA
jgi:hypothetical protein